MAQATDHFLVSWILPFPGVHFSEPVLCCLGLCLLFPPDFYLGFLLPFLFGCDGGVVVVKELGSITFTLWL